MGGEGGFNIEGAPKTMFQDENIFLYHLTIDHASSNGMARRGDCGPRDPAIFSSRGFATLLCLVNCPIYRGASSVGAIKGRSDRWLQTTDIEAADDDDSTCDSWLRADFLGL